MVEPMGGRLERTDREIDRWNQAAGTAYGFLFGLLFALFVWGYDAIRLAAAHADQPWAKLLLGLPLCGAVGALLGFLSARISFGPVCALLGGLAFGVLAWWTAHLPYEGASLAAWMAHPDLWGINLYPFGFAGSVRMWLTMPVAVMLGAAGGYLQTWAVEWAWAVTTSAGRMGLRSWLALLVCAPIALVIAVVADTQINAPMRGMQMAVSGAVQTALAPATPVEEDIEYRSLKPFREHLYPAYIVHLAAYDSETMAAGYVDVSFESGFVLRCGLVKERVVFCEDFGAKTAAWMEDLIHAGRSGERRWEVGQVRVLEPSGWVVAWLEEHADRMGGQYRLERLEQAGGYFYLAARFDSGFVLACRFSGGVPVVVDLCSEAPAGLP